MASITHEKSNGRRRIQFIGADGKRKSVRLGKVTQRVAEAIKVRVEQLNAANIARHAPDPETSAWVAQLDQALSEKLAAVGLMPRRKSSTLKGFIDSYFALRSSVKKSTQTVWGHTRRCLVEFFGADKPLRDLTAGCAEEWRADLIRQGLAENTIRRRCGIAKQFFGYALRKGLINQNPFSGLVAATRGNPSRNYYVTREETQKVLDACPDDEWRLLFALSRYGGLRCPSEHLALTWGDIDWEHGRMTVHSPKTEHHPGGESRMVPLFPELRPLMERTFDSAEPGTTYVITRYRNTNGNLRTQLERIIRRAGLKPWPKLFHNLRSSRETELAEEFPLHVVCAWIGNSQAVAQKHYLQVTDEHFTRAASGAESGARGAPLVQNQAQQPSAMAGNGDHLEREGAEKPEDCTVLHAIALPEDEAGVSDSGRRGTRTPDFDLVRIAL